MESKLNFYMDFYEVIKKEIDKWDLYGLLEIHCPEDDCEIREITKRIKLENNIYEIASIISEIFTNSFNDSEIFSIKNCMKVSEKIKKEMEDGIFYYFVNYYELHKKIDNHFKKFNLLLDVLKSEYESNVIDMKKIYDELEKNATEYDRGYTGCYQMIKRLKEWSNS